MFLFRKDYCFVSECSNQQFQGTTPLKFNIAPEKWWLEDDPFLWGPGTFSGETSLLNFGRKTLLMVDLPSSRHFANQSDSCVLSTLVEAVLVLSASLELQKHPERSEVLGRKFNPKKSGKRRANIEGFPWQPLGPLLKVKLLVGYM